MAGKPVARGEVPGFRAACQLGALQALSEHTPRMGGNNQCFLPVFSRMHKLDGEAVDLETLWV